MVRTFREDDLSNVEVHHFMGFAIPVDLMLKTGGGPYLPGEGRLVLLSGAVDFKGACMSAVKIEGGLRNGDHHWG